MSGDTQLCDWIEFTPQLAYCGLGFPDYDDQSTPTDNHIGTL